MKKVLGLVLAIFFVGSIFLTSCASATKVTEKSSTPAATSIQVATSELSKTEPNTKKYKIGFSVKTLTNEPFQAFISDGIKKKVEGLGHEFVLMTTGTAMDIAQQVTQIEDLINMGCDGIIINPIDSNAIVPVMEKAHEKGIQLIFVDTPPVEGLEDLYISYIGTDNFAAAKVAGEAMAKDLGGTGKVVIVRGADGNLVGNARADGFKAGLEGSNVEVVSEQTGNWTNDDAMQAMENMLQANPDIDGVWSCADVMLDGILQAINNNPNVDKNLAIYSFDGAIKGCDLVIAGKIKGTMAQYPAIMGEIAVNDLIEVLNGTKKAEDFPKFIDSGTNIINTSNVDEAMKTAF